MHKQEKGGFNQESFFFPEKKKEQSWFHDISSICQLAETYQLARKYAAWNAINAWKLEEN